MATSAWPSYGSQKFPTGYSDVESGGGDVFQDPSLRWAFVQKVYGILSFQLLLTLAAATVVVKVESVRLTVMHSPLLVIASMIVPFILICALSAYHQHHPLNLILLGLFSLSFSVTLGLSCAFVPAAIVLEAILLTAVVVVSLSLFSFWAARNGEDFSWLGPILFTALSILVFSTIIQLFFPFGSFFTTVYAAIGAIIFSLYIIYDTAALLHRYSYDEYIWASVMLYLDIINLFSFLLDLLNAGRD
ncbi:hypothetical protein CLOM_g22585 [Closterium sp. NIES-68]|nr:hypothetical protein CLOM_g22585 [Closterium sp. NIES-68]GJP79392.1 hypothetical protein CLOP_g9626 [Closterium sp. NIES-67]